MSSPGVHHIRPGRGFQELFPAQGFPQEALETRSAFAGCDGEQLSQTCPCGGSSDVSGAEQPLAAAASTGVNPAGMLLLGGVDAPG